MERIIQRLLHMFQQNSEIGKVKNIKKILITVNNIDRFS